VANTIRLNEVSKGVFIAWRLFLWDRKAVALIDDDPGGALKSFWCALLVLPLVFVNLALQHATPSDVPGNFGVLVDRAGLARTLAILAIFYVIQWTAWPVLMDWLARFLDSGRHYFRYVAAYNWSQVMIVMLTMVYAVVDYSGIASKQLLVVVNMAILTVMWAYHWFILRNVLDVNGGFAAVLVAAHFALAVIIGIASTATVV